MIHDITKILEIRKTQTKYLGLLLWFALCSCLWVQNVGAADPAWLQDVQVHPLPNDKMQVEMIFSCPVPPPKSFAVETPASVILDFPGIKNKLPKTLTNQSLSGGLAKGLTIIEGGDKTRIIVKLKKMVPYETLVHGNRILLTLAGEASLFPPAVGACENVGLGILSFDFRRGPKGEGRLVFNLSSPQVPVDFREEKGKIVARFPGVEIPERLLRKYDVSDFGTPIKGFTLSRHNQDVLMTMQATGDYDKMAYQMDNQFVVEIRGLTSAERAAQRTEGRYTGERISLNFQDVEIRAVLQIVADFAGFNLITSDTVKGNITLRLQNVPWDQALDIILKSKDLGMRKQGNVVMIAPATEIAAREKQELDNLKLLSELGPLRSELIPINYAKAEDLQTILKDKANSIMTSRGSVTVDKRTNTLLVQDIDEKIGEIRALIAKLDIPVRQVEISTQIITASDVCEEALGMRFGGALNPTFGSRRIGIGGTIERGRAITEFSPSTGLIPPPLGTSGQATQTVAVIPNSIINQNRATGPLVQATEGLFSDLGVNTAAGIASVGLAFAKLPNGTLLDLEIQALESESKAKTIARPKLLTTDQNKAVVEQGFDIPYQEATSSGATSTSYKKAVLKLEVTPHITPDDKITLDVVVTNDTPGAPVPQALGGQAITINTNRLETKVLVDNGETVVLGGILQLTKNKTRVKVPFFGDLPLVGLLFRSKTERDQRQELLIFITPKIIKPITNQEDP